ncbi:15798_t:CDS:2, partial [Funneliformis caledonium]
AWLDVSQNTILNCWIKTGILPSIDYIQQEISSDQIDIELDVELEDIEDLLDILPESAV